MRASTSSIKRKKPPVIIRSPFFRTLPVLLLGSLAQAAPIPGLFPTGVDNQGQLLVPGSADPHYELIQSPDAAFPGPLAYVVNDSGSPIPPWLTNGPSSKWIAPKASQTSGNAPGDYIYRLRFNLTGFDPGTAIINGLWTSDNSGTAILLNGVPTGVSNDGNFRVLANTFTITNGFTEDENTLDFVVNNATLNPSPTGLRVELSGIAEAWPPPGTPPTILSPPVSRTNALGESASFTVRATGAPPLAYAWRKNSIPIPGATRSAHVILAVQGSDLGSYDIVVSNPWGAQTSAPPAVLSVRYPTPAELNYEPPGPSSRRTGLTITEIMYHPAPRTDGRNLEFIELYNSNPFPEDLSGYRLSGDWDYVFPAGTTLPGQAYLVVGAVPSDLQAVYGVAGVVGGITNNLPNSGGTIRLRKPSGGIVLEVTYHDQPPWPVAADGAGHSLVLARPSFGENDSAAWSASAWIGGSPGGTDPLPTGLLENLRINEFLAHTDFPDLDYIELHNHSAVPVEISGCILTDDSTTNKFVIPHSTTIPARGFAHYTEASLKFALDAAGETIYLKNPAGTRVLDAVRFGAQQNSVATGRYPDGGDQFHRLPAWTPGYPNPGFLVGPVFINEIMYHPLTGDEHQYVELHNRGAQPVNLGGWRLGDGINFSFPSNTVIASGGYLVVARDLARLLASYSTLNTTNTVGNFSGSLARDGERITLTMPDTIVSTNASGVVWTNLVHIVVDEVTYGSGGAWGRWADGGGSSLELVDARANHRLAANWADSDESAKAPWTMIEATGLLDHPHPSVPTADQLQIILLGGGEVLVDQVEVFSPGGGNRLPNPDFDSGTTDWFFQGTHRLSSWSPTGGYGGSGALHLRATARGNQAADRIRAPLTTAFSAGQTATIRARVRWLSGWPEILFRLKGGHFEVASRLDVPASPGTPGAPNSRTLPNLAPAIFNVGHRPVLPAGGEPIRVSASVQDPDGLASVRVRYRLDPATNLFTVPMLDDGLSGDLVAGDGVYTGIIPPHPAGSLVAFRVEATDGFVPAATAAFPVDAPARECLVRFGESNPGPGFGTYRFWVTQDTLNWWTTREKTSSESLDATFVYGTNRVCYNIGARYAGSPYSAGGYNSPVGNLCGYTLEFAEDDLFLGEDGMVLDYLARDPTGQREQLMFWLLEQLGLPNNYRRYVHLYVNGFKRGVIYEDAQRPGKGTLSQWFPNDDEGSLFKTDVWDEFNDTGGRIGSLILLNTLENFTSTGGAKKVARYRWHYEPRAVRGSANDFSDLFNLVDAVNAPTGGYASAVELSVDLDHWMRTFCMNDLASYWDGFGNPNAKNTYLYKPQQETWKLMCWDMDVGLGTGHGDPVDAALFPALSDPAMTRLYSQPGFVRPYWRALDQALNTFFRVGPGTSIETILYSRYAAFQAHGIDLASPDAIKTWIVQRRAFLQTQLAGVAATFTISGPLSFTTNRNAIVLTGTAPVNVKTITINGVPQLVTWTSLTTWRIVVPVSVGTTALNVQALDQNDQPLAGMSGSVAVTYTGAEERPEQALVINEIMHNPALPGAAYVELFNRSTNYAFNLSGVRLRGLDFTFPAGSLITNGQFMVLTENRAGFGNAYGWNIPVAGQYPGNLQSDGETLTLLRPGTGTLPETIFTRVRYGTAPPWPIEANGTGSSLQLVDAAQDNWRIGNWTAVSTNPPAASRQWVYFSTNGFASSSTLYIYLQSPGELYLDDLSLVTGNVPNAGPNLLVNPGFETALAGSWTATANFGQSAPSTNYARSGNFSLRLVATAAGTGNGNSVYQVVSPSLPANQPCALSFWYLQSTNSPAPTLVVRLSGSSLTSGSLSTGMSLPPAPPAPATPGATNSVAAFFPVFPTLWINEVQAQNLTGITNLAGQPAPWIELFNPGPGPASLSGVFLANDAAQLTAWAFPTNAVLNAGSFALVFADGQTGLSTTNELHTGFVLSPQNGALFLSRLHAGRPQVLDVLEYRSLAPDRSWGSLPDAQSFERQQFFFPTPGATNNGASPPLTVFINEWMADNLATLRDPVDNDFEDWFEIYNPGTNNVDLGGCFLTDTLIDKFQFEVPNNGQYVIPPGGFLLVWADSERSQNSTNRADLHVSFKLDKFGEALHLFAPDGTLIDSVVFGNQTTDVSQGRFPDGGLDLFHMPHPTPRGANLVPNSAPVLESIPDQWVHAGQTLRFYSSATDPQSAFQQLTFTLDPGVPAGATIHPESGLFTWPVLNVPVPGTNFLTIRVTDNGQPPLSSAASFHVVVVPLPRLHAFSAGDLLQLSFPTAPGQNYRVEFKDHLSDPAWVVLSAVLPGTGGLLQVDVDPGSQPHRYFRLTILP